MAQSKITTLTVPDASPTLSGNSISHAAKDDRPFLRLDIHLMREALPHIGGGELKVWIAYLLRKNRDGEAWPSLKTIARDTGLSASRASKVRNVLVADGWLIPVGCRRGSHGNFSAPRFRPVISQKHRTLKTAHGEDAVPQNFEAPHAENNSHRTLKTAHEVDVIEVESKEVRTSSQQPAVREIHRQDPTFDEALRRFRAAMGKSLGVLGKNADRWAKLVNDYGQAAVLAGIDLWVAENRDYIANLNYPLANFLNRSTEMCEAARQTPPACNEAEDDDGYTHMLKMFPELAGNKGRLGPCLGSRVA